MKKKIIKYSIIHDEIIRLKEEMQCLLNVPDTIFESKTTEVN